MAGLSKAWQGVAGAQQGVAGFSKVLSESSTGEHGLAGLGRAEQGLQCVCIA